MSLPIGGAQVLAHREDVDIGAADVSNGLQQLLPGLAQAQHDAALSEHLFIHEASAIEELQGAVVFGTGADDAIEPGHRLQVMVEDVGTGLHDGAQGRPGAAKVGDEDLHRAVGDVFAAAADALGEDGGAAIGQVVAGHRGDYDVFEAQVLGGVGHSMGLVPVHLLRAAMSDGAEAAAAGADVAQDHEGGGPLLPALEDVGAERLLADRVQGKLAHKGLEVTVIGADAGPHLEPGGPLARPRGRRRVGLEEGEGLGFHDR